MEETLYHTLMRFYVESRRFFTFLPLKVPEKLAGLKIKS